VVRGLEEPEIIAAEVAKEETMAEDQRAEIRQQVALIETTLAKCDREAQRWADAYAAEVINLAELKGYRTEIEGRRQSLLAEREACERRMEAIRAAVQQVEALIDYCARVRAALQSFEAAEKRLAFEALDISVTWTPGQPPRIQGTIPIDTIAPIPLASHRRCSATGESHA
jgi:chromosome segregation ATPase